MKNVFFVFCLSVLFSCSKKTVNDCPCSSEPCTDHLESIVVKVKDKNGNPVSLDYYRTYKSLVGLEIDIQSKRSVWEDSIGKALGAYPIISDIQSDMISTCGEPFVFIGKKNGKEIVKEYYMIKNDCCHVALISGNREIIIDL